jgi:hypothetical protein
MYETYLLWANKPTKHENRPWNQLCSQIPTLLCCIGDSGPHDGSNLPFKEVDEVSYPSCFFKQASLHSNWCFQLEYLHMKCASRHLIKVSNFKLVTLGTGLTPPLCTACVAVQGFGARPGLAPQPGRPGGLASAAVTVPVFPKKLKKNLPAM